MKSEVTLSEAHPAWTCTAWAIHVSGLVVGPLYRLIRTVGPLQKRTRA